MKLTSKHGSDFRSLPFRDVSIKFVRRKIHCEKRQQQSISKIGKWDRVRNEKCLLQTNILIQKIFVQTGTNVLQENETGKPSESGTFLLL